MMSNLSRSTSLNDISSQEEDGILDATAMTDGVDNSGSQSGQCNYVIYILMMKNIIIISIQAQNICYLLLFCGCYYYFISISSNTTGLGTHFNFTASSSKHL